MDTIHIKYPSIEQFRNIVKHVKVTTQYVGKDEDGNTIVNRDAVMPVLEFEGTVKIHGTNAAVCWNKNTGIYVQARNRIITTESDNAGFAFFVHSKETAMEELINYIIDGWGVEDHETLCIFGEWAGGNIQTGVAVCDLEKMFVIFDICIFNPITEERHWIPVHTVASCNHHLMKFLNKDRIFFIGQFPTWKMKIDFNEPEKAQNELVAITDAVEAECPVGRHFGASGVGEGVVWRLVDQTEKYGHVKFKIKGNLHSISKVKTLAPVDVERIEGIKEFVEYAVTEARLNQAIETVFTQNNEAVDIRKMGDFLRWIMSDITKEETDTMAANGLEPKMIGKYVSDKARKWFLSYVR